MKYLKKYEIVNQNPKIDDYVILNDMPSVIGRIKEVNRNFTYYIKFIGNSYITDRRVFSTSEIKYWSENKKELELIADTNKFNI